MHPEITWQLMKIRQRELLEEAAHYSRVQQVRQHRAGLIDRLQEKARTLGDALGMRRRPAPATMPPPLVQDTEAHEAEPGKKAA